MLASQIFGCRSLARRRIEHLRDSTGKQDGDLLDWTCIFVGRSGLYELLAVFAHDVLRLRPRCEAHVLGVHLLNVEIPLYFDRLLVEHELPTALLLGRRGANASEVKLLGHELLRLGVVFVCDIRRG